VATASLALAGLLIAAATAVDWTGLAGRDGLRVGLLAATLAAAAVLYFGVLGVFGFRPSQFARRAAP
jgi:putative peptidoglycan lipid II flippase